MFRHNRDLPRRPAAIAIAPLRLTNADLRLRNVAERLGGEAIFVLSVDHFDYGAVPLKLVEVADGDHGRTRIHLRAMKEGRTGSCERGESPALPTSTH